MFTTEHKTCQNCRRSFDIDGEDFAFYEKMKVPPPTWCPECRMIRRMAWWNERNLFKKKDIDGKVIFSAYPEESYFKIIDRDEWWKDSFDAMQYGRDYDFSKPFFPQLKKLAGEVPFPSRAGTNLVNCDYCNNSNNSKDCYMCFNVDECEDCMYMVFAKKNKDAIDGISVYQCESCYETTLSGISYKNNFAYQSPYCRDSYFLNYSDNCNNCFGSVNLRHKEYYIWNKQYSKEEYFKKIEEFNLGSHAALESLKNKSKDFFLRFPYPYIKVWHNSGVITGDNIFESKNIRDSFAIEEAENLRYCQSAVFGIRDCYDYTNFGNNAELIYESVECGESISNLKFCFGCWSNSRNLEYCLNCHSSEDCFGCVGLKKAKYCIFNKQYSKEDYEKLRARIIEQMNKNPYRDAKGRVYKYGEFMPPEMAPYAANESVVVDRNQFDQDKALSYGLRWREVDPVEYKTTINAADMADHIKDVSDGVTQELISCLNCKRAYRILPKELDFYRRLNLPLPRRCPNCRYEERNKQRNYLKLYPGTCQCAGAASGNKVYKNAARHFHGEEPCPNKFETAHDPKAQRIVYCLECYHKELL